MNNRRKNRRDKRQTSYPKKTIKPDLRVNVDNGIVPNISNANTIPTHRPNTRPDPDCVNEALYNCDVGAPDGAISYTWNAGYEVCENGAPFGNAWAEPVLVRDMGCNGMSGTGACGEEWEPSIDCRFCTPPCEGNNSWGPDQAPTFPPEECFNQAIYNQPMHQGATPPEQSQNCKQLIFDYQNFGRRQQLCNGNQGGGSFEKIFDGYRPNGSYCLIWGYCGGFDMSTCWDARLTFVTGCPIITDEGFTEWDSLWDRWTYLLPDCEMCNDVDTCHDFLANEPGPLWGCTDPSADNFIPNATEEDGSCQYTYACTSINNEQECMSQMTYMWGEEQNACIWVYDGGIGIIPGTGHIGPIGTCFDYITAQHWDCKWDEWLDYDCYCECTDGASHRNVADCNNFSGGGDATCKQPCIDWCEARNPETGAGGGQGGGRRAAGGHIKKPKRKMRIGGDVSLPGGISPAPVDGITYNYPAGSFLISFPFRAYPQEDFGSHVSNSDPSDGVGWPLEEGVWSVEEFVSMLAPGGQIKKITGVHPTQNQGVATQKVGGVWVGSLTHIYPQMAYWVEFDSPINQRVNAPYGMISRDYKIVLHAGPNYRAYPYPDKPEYRDIEPDDISVVSNTIADGNITRELIGTGAASNYANITVTDPVTEEITFQGWTWTGSFKFNPGQGFILQTSEGMNDYWQAGCGNNWQHMDLNCPSLFGGGFVSSPDRSNNKQDPKCPSGYHMNKGVCKQKAKPRRKIRRRK